MKLRLPRRRVWRVAMYLGSLVLILLAADVILVESRRNIHPGFDTTRILEPTLPDGSIDYCVAVDEHFGAGVTPQNNAAIAMLQAFGRQAIPKKQPPDGLTDKLGMPHIPETGDYFVAYDDYCKQHSVTMNPSWSDATNPRQWPVTCDQTTTQWIKDSEKPLALLTEASKRSRFFIPYYAGYRYEVMAEILLPHVKLQRDATRALQVRALMRLAQDDVAGFRQDTLTIRRLCRLYAQQATMVEKLVATAGEVSACENIRVALSSGKINSEQARAMVQEYATLGDLPSLTDSLDNGERFFALDALQVLARRSPIEAGRLLNGITSMPEWRFGPPIIFQFLPIPYEEAMRVVNHMNDGALAAARQPTYPQRADALRLWHEQIGSREMSQLSLRDLTSPYWPRQLFAPAWIKSVQRQETCKMESRLTHLALLLNAYKSDHKEYPQSLDQLAPAYLDRVPNDFFSERPLVYLHTQGGYTLYSVGPNMVDDGGKRESPSDDVVASTPDLNPATSPSTGAGL